MMKAEVRIVITCTGAVVNDVRRVDPYQPGQPATRDLIVKADFRPLTPGRHKSLSLPHGATIRAQAPRWALNPIRARVLAGAGSCVLTKSGGSEDGSWAHIGLRPAFEWCLIVPSAPASTESAEHSATLVAFIPNGGDVDGNVRKFTQSFTIADLARLPRMLAAPAAARLTDGPPPPSGPRPPGAPLRPGQPPQVPPMPPQVPPMPRPGPPPPSTR